MFVFRSFASELQVESWRASVGLSCHLVKTLLSMGVARLPGFDYYQCRLPTSDALPDLNELTFVSCICLGKLNWGMQMFDFQKIKKLIKTPPQKSILVRTHWISSGRVGMRHLRHFPQKDMLLFYSLRFSGPFVPMRERFWDERVLHLKTSMESENWLLWKSNPLQVPAACFPLQLFLF